MTLGTYPMYLMLSVSQSDDELAANIRSQPPEYDDPCTTAHTYQLPDGLIVLRLRFFPRTPLGFAILGHEIFHAVEFLMDRVGIPRSLDTSEAWAYSISYLTEKIYKELDKQSKRYDTNDS